MTATSCRPTFHKFHIFYISVISLLIIVIIVSKLFPFEIKKVNYVHPVVEADIKRTSLVTDIDTQYFGSLNATRFLPGDPISFAICAVDQTFEEKPINVRLKRILADTAGTIVVEKESNFAITPDKYTWTHTEKDILESTSVPLGKYLLIISITTDQKDAIFRPTDPREVRFRPFEIEIFPGMIEGKPSVLWRIMRTVKFWEN